MFKKGSKARIVADAQGDLAGSLIGRGCTILGRLSGMDVDGDKAYAGLAENRKKPTTFWRSELEPTKKRK